MQGILDHLTANWTTWITILGLSFEIVGVYLMAHKFFQSVAFRDRPKLLFLALFRCEKSSINKLADMGEEASATVLQGLIVVLLGFLFQLVGTIAVLF